MRGDGARQIVLKWEQGTRIGNDLRNAVAVLERLRAVGYPAPRHLFVGVASPLGVADSVQVALSGTLLGRRLDRPFLDQLLTLNALERGRAIETSVDWPRPVADPIMHGGDGFCLPGMPRAHSTRTGDIPERAAYLSHCDAETKRALVERANIRLESAQVEIVDEDGMSISFPWIVARRPGNGERQHAAACCPTLNDHRRAETAR